MTATVADPVRLGALAELLADADSFVTVMGDWTGREPVYRMTSASHTSASAFGVGERLLRHGFLYGDPGGVPLAELHATVILDRLSPQVRATLVSQSHGGVVTPLGAVLAAAGPVTRRTLSVLPVSREDLSGAEQCLMVRAVLDVGGLMVADVTEYVYSDAV